MNATQNQPPFPGPIHAHSGMEYGRQGQPLMANPARYEHVGDLALWSVSKGHSTSWGRPQKEDLSADHLRREYSKMQQNGTIKEKLNKIYGKSYYNSTRDTINDLVKNQNRELWKYNAYLQWKLVGIELHWIDPRAKKRYLECIKILLKTKEREHTPSDEPIFRGMMPTVGQRPPVSVPLTGPNPQRQEPRGMQDFSHVQASFENEIMGSRQQHNGALAQHPSQPQSGQIHNQTQHQDQSFNQGPMHASMHNPMQGSVHNSMQGSQNFGPPPPPPPPNQQNMAAHVQGHASLPQLPLEGLGHRQPMQQQHAHHVTQIPPVPRSLQPYLDQPNALPKHKIQHHDQKQQPVPKNQQHKQSIHPSDLHMVGGHLGIQQNLPRAPVELLDRNLLQSQKAKPMSFPAPYHENSDDYSESDSDASEESFSAESIEADALNIRGRPRSVTQMHSGSRHHSQGKSQSRGRVSKGYKHTPLHPRSRSQLDPPPIGIFNGRSSNQHSPKSSIDSLPAQFSPFPKTSNGRSSKHHSPKSSIESLPPRHHHVPTTGSNPQPQFQVQTSPNTGVPPGFTIQINTAPAVGNNNDRDPRRSRNASRPRNDMSDSRSDHENRHGSDHERHSMRRSFAKSPPISPRQSPTYPMSRTSSATSVSYVDSMSPGQSLADDSVFDEEIHHRVRHASIHDPNRQNQHREFRSSNSNGTFDTREERPSKFDRRSSHHKVNDYPPVPRNGSPRERNHPAIHHYDAAGEKRRRDSVTSWPLEAHTPSPYANAQAPNPFDPRYPDRRTMSYSGELPSVPLSSRPIPMNPHPSHETANIVGKQKIYEAIAEALRKGPQNSMYTDASSGSQLGLEALKIFEAGIEALQNNGQASPYSAYGSPRLSQDKLDMQNLDRIIQAGLEAIRQKGSSSFERQPLRRSKTSSDTGAPRDIWANPHYSASDDGHRARYQPGYMYR